MPLVKSMVGCTLYSILFIFRSFDANHNDATIFEEDCFNRHEDKMNTIHEDVILVRDFQNVIKFVTIRFENTSFRWFFLNIICPNDQPQEERIARKKSSWFRTCARRVADCRRSASHLPDYRINQYHTRPNILRGMGASIDRQDKPTVVGNRRTAKIRNIK